MWSRLPRGLRMKMWLGRFDSRYSGRPYRRISGQVSATAITTKIIPTPPENGYTRQDHHEIQQR
jgi:hypothetical protein